MQTNLCYEFGPFRLDPIRRLLLRHGHPIQLPPKAFETLLVLVRRSGEIVEKDEFMKIVWSDAFVEESNLSQNIFILRKILGDNPEGRQYIENVPKRGYRFVSTVTEVQEQTLVPGAEPHAGAHAAPEVEKTYGHNKNIPSLAVLPIFNTSDDVKLEYLGDGMTESIVNSLSQISSLRVMACSTVSCYKNQEVHPQEVGRALDVQLVAIGKILSVGEAIIIRIELVDVTNGWQIWGEQYDSSLSDILHIQKEIVWNIVDNVYQKLNAREQERVFKFYTNSTEAYQLYLKGRYFLNKHTEKSYQQAIESFQQAINIDGKYALAYSGLADSYILFDFYGLRSPWQTASIARTAAAMALKLDDMLAETHTSIARIKLIYDRDFEGAEREFKTAIELNPKYAEAYNGYSHCLLELGKIKESFAAIKAAKEFAPLDVDINMYLGWHYLYDGRYEDAINQLRKTLELDPKFYRARLLLGMAYGQNGQLPTAIAEYKQAALLEDTPITSGFLGQAHALMGEREEALSLLNKMLEQAKLTYVPPFAIALIYTGLGQRDAAFEWLEKAFIEHTQWQAWLKIIPEFDTLRSDPRLSYLLQRIQLLDG